MRSSKSNGDMLFSFIQRGSLVLLSIVNRYEGTQLRVQRSFYWEDDAMEFIDFFLLAKEASIVRNQKLVWPRHNQEYDIMMHDINIRDKYHSFKENPPKILLTL